MLVSLALALSLTSSGLPPAMSAHLAAWRRFHGPGWRLDLRPGTGHLELLYSGGVAAAAPPADDGEFIALAYERLLDSHAMHGIDLENLVPDRVTFLPLAAIGSADKIAVHFRESVDGVPVRDGNVNVLFAVDGTMLAIQSTGLPGVANLATTPVVPAESAASAAVASFTAQVGPPPNRVDPPQLVVDQVPDGPRLLPRLAWLVDVRHESAEFGVDGRRYAIDATTGRVLSARSNVHRRPDVSGRVLSCATPGVDPDDTNALPVPMREMTLTATDGSATYTTETDADGYFTFEGAGPRLAVTFRYRAPDHGGHPATEITSSPEVGPQQHTETFVLGSRGTATVVMNTPADPFVTAQANAFQAISRLRSWARATNPTDDLPAYPIHAKVNKDHNGACWALYEGIADGVGVILLDRAGTEFKAQPGSIAPRQCVNYAYSTVVTHEHGHYLNDLYGTGNAFDGMGEGNASVWSVYLWDTPVVGKDYAGPGTFLAHGNNTRQYCDDPAGDPACSSDSHERGEIWLGAAWKIRRNLKRSEGDAQGGLTADKLFLVWMEAFDQIELAPIIEKQWLILDDTMDDGRWSLCEPAAKPTPHYLEIDAAFRAQGFPGFPGPDGPRCLPP